MLNYKKKSHLKLFSLNINSFYFDGNQLIKFVMHDNFKGFFKGIILRYLKLF